MLEYQYIKVKTENIPQNNRLSLHEERDTTYKSNVAK